MTLIVSSTGEAQLLPPPPSNGASTLVKDGFTTAQNYANTAFNQAIAFLTSLNGADTGLGLRDEVILHLLVGVRLFLGHEMRTFPADSIKARRSIPATKAGYKTATDT